MSGHSKWATIKHKKAATDAKKGKEFTRASNLITIAAKQGGGDPKMNFSLRLAVDKARAVNMPAANIERAIKKGTGELGGTAPEELVYEGYASGGVAILVEAMTDNRNRTASEVRSTFSKYGGSLAEAGAVAYLFEKKGQIFIELQGQKMGEDEVELFILDSGADDFEEDEGQVTVYTKPSNLQKVKEALEANEVIAESAEISYIPKSEVKISEENIAGKIMKLVDALEEIEDVTNVFANFDISEDILEKMS